MGEIQYIVLIPSKEVMCMFLDVTKILLLISIVYRISLCISEHKNRGHCNTN